MFIWVIGCVILLLLAWLQIVFGHYGKNGHAIINWLLPSITPTLLLVTGVWANNALTKVKNMKKWIEEFIEQL